MWQYPGFEILLARIGDALPHGLWEQTIQIIEGDEVRQPTRALECLAEMAGIDVGYILVGMVLQELVVSDGAAQTTEHPELAEVQIGNVGAIILSR